MKIDTSSGRHREKEIRMYFPKDFSTARAIELGELARQAYDQFEAFENEKDWKLSADYSLIKELQYTWTPAKTIEKGIRNYDFIVRRLARSKRDEAVRIPIGFIAQRGRRLFVILRGTQTAKEWVRNFNISLQPYMLPGYGNVHEGFMGTYLVIRASLLEALSSMKGRMEIFLAGHSLGAALATLASPDIESSTDRRISALYTYGSPRVGDDAFVRAFNRCFPSRSFRLVNTSDVVTSIPLPIPLAGIMGGYFSHVDTPVDFTVQEDDLEKNHSMETYLFQLNEGRRRRSLFGRFSV